MSNLQCRMFANTSSSDRKSHFFSILTCVISFLKQCIGGGSNHTGIYFLHCNYATFKGIVKHSVKMHSIPYAYSEIVRVIGKTTLSFSELTSLAKHPS